MSILLGILIFFSGMLIGIFLMSLIKVNKLFKDEDPPKFKY